MSKRDRESEELRTSDVDDGCEDPSSVPRPESRHTAGTHVLRDASYI